mmetsp:Transcript_2346/g.9184  ORF Transcript_2346/g.9184 Transcript_2346/m.9184 type:complete len:224 (+) Transcript_2346:538-1209(+)
MPGVVRPSSSGTGGEGIAPCHRERSMGPDEPLGFRLLADSAPPAPCRFSRPLLAAKVSTVPLLPLSPRPMPNAEPGIGPDPTDVGKSGSKSGAAARAAAEPGDARKPDDDKPAPTVNALASTWRCPPPPFPETAALVPRECAEDAPEPPAAPAPALPALRPSPLTESSSGSGSARVAANQPAPPPAPRAPGGDPDAIGSIATGGGRLPMPPVAGSLSLLLLGA